jgi:hypothetical protein
MRQNSPHALVVAAAALLFLCMPDGIPFLYAACASPGASGSVTNYGVNRCGPCITSGNPQFVIYRTDNCTLVWDTPRCELTATVDLDINESGCKVYWKTFCGGQTCGSATLAGTGIMTGSRSMTVRCDGSDENMQIELGHPQTCSSCSPSQCFVAQGTCTAS